METVQELIPTSAVPHLRYSFPAFNPPQSLVFPHREKNVNIVVMSPTSSGKTQMAELAMDSALRNGKKAIYTAPMKALGQEKLREWRSENHAFSKYKISEITGDNRFTADRLGEINAADILVMTTEMLDSKSRHADKDKDHYLFKTGVCVIDEGHLVSDESRGDSLECGLMRFSEINPEARLIFLSATVKNSKDLADWATVLNGKETVHIRSTYRPCILRYNFEPFEGSREYFANEESKVEAAFGVIAKFDPDDHAIFFVHGKKTGHAMVARLRQAGFKAEFHYSDLSSEKRRKIETAFREKKIDHIVATSTLAVGVNLPARRVVIVGTKRGRSEVSSIEIIQEAGRSGRPGFDKEGDCHVVVESNRAKEEERRILDEPLVISTLLSEENLAFHLVSGIERGDLKTREDAICWFERSLAARQGIDLSEELLDLVMFQLEKARATKKNADGEYECLAVGKVAAWFYQSPFDVSDWHKNFEKAFEKTADPDDAVISFALASTESNKKKVISDPFTENQRSRYAVQTISRGYMMTENVMTLAMILNERLKGNELPPDCYGIFSQLSNDIERTVDTIKTVGKLTGKYDPGEEFWDILAIRIQTGASREMVPLIKLDGIGAKRAKKLIEAGIRTPKDLLEKEELVKELIGKKTAEKAIASAKGGSG